MLNPQENEVLEDLIAMLPSIKQEHAPGTPLYKLLNKVAISEARRHFSENKTKDAHFNDVLKDLSFPYHEMGNINSLHLFGMDELIIFSFYRANRGRYKNVLDLGANIGLHSIVLSKCGYNVRCYEPDPKTFAVLRRNLDLNNAKSVEPINAAVSTVKGEMEFVRVLGNMTGSHLAGAKPPGYGDLETFKVPVDEFRSALSWADLAKIDIEGHEKEVLLTTTAKDWEKTDALVEVGSAVNAAHIFEHLHGIKINMFAQKLGWKKVQRVSDMPTSYKEGTLFLTSKDEMFWNN